MIKNKYIYTIYIYKLLLCDQKLEMFSIIVLPSGNNDFNNGCVLLNMVEHKAGLKLFLFFSTKVLILYLTGPIKWFNL